MIDWVILFDHHQFLVQKLAFDLVLHKHNLTNLEPPEQYSNHRYGQNIRHNNYELKRKEISPQEYQQKLTAARHYTNPEILREGKIWELIRC